MAETEVKPQAKETPTPPAEVTKTKETVETPAEKTPAEPKPAAKEGTTLVEAPKTEEKPAETKVPEKYDLKLPEKSLLKESVVKEVTEFAKQHGLSNEDAQAVLDRREADVQAHVDNEKERLAQQSEDWKESSMNDSEIGGDKFEESVEIAKRGLDAVASEGFRKALVDTGLGNHPEVIRVFRRVGLLISDDKLVDGKVPLKKELTQAEKMYPPKNKDE